MTFYQAITWIGVALCVSFMYVIVNALSLVFIYGFLLLMFVIFEGAKK